MACRLCITALVVLAGVFRYLDYADDPRDADAKARRAEATARRAFRHTLFVASPRWSDIELECPSPGCSNEVKACWTRADGKYIFSGFRAAKSVGGGAVSVHAADRELITYVYMSDGSPTKVILGKGVKADMSWTERRASEFFYATPANAYSYKD
jgi:hypothetical protein